jgi:hypothetical protein
VAVAAVHCVEQGRISYNVQLGQGRALGEQIADNVEVATPGAVVQRGALALWIAVAVVDLGTRSEQEPNNIEVAVLASQQDWGAAVGTVDVQDGRFAFAYQPLDAAKVATDGAPEQILVRDRRGS